jgi:hypothetical protein
MSDSEKTLVAKATANFVCREILAEVLGSRWAGMRLEFSEEAVKLTDLLEAIDRASGADGWQAMQKKGGLTYCLSCYLPIAAWSKYDFQSYSNNFFSASRSSVSPRANNLAVLSSHQTPCQNPLPSRHMILKLAIEPWRQYSIFRKTASIILADRARAQVRCRQCRRPTSLLAGCAAFTL